MLHLAVSTGDKEKVQHLLAKGVDVDSKDEKGRTPLHIVGGHKEIAEILLQYGADVNAVDNEGFTPLGRAISSDQITTAAFLISKGAGGICPKFLINLQSRISRLFSIESKKQDNEEMNGLWYWR